MATYTYDPAKCRAGGVDQMRSECGDTVVDGEAATSALCDEEYDAIIKSCNGNWRKAKFECLDAICKKLAFEVNTSVGGLSYSLAERYPRFEEMRDSAKRELKALNSVPRAGNPASLSPHGGTPYFYNDMQANRRKF